MTKAVQSRETNKLVVFEDKKIRRVFHNGEWYFSIIDVVEVLTGSSNSRRYWSDLKMQLIEKEGFVQLYGKIVQLKLVSSDGKKYLTDTANTETLFRVIQSIPSPKAEPFKRWLAQVGYERIKEIEDPELATQRTRAVLSEIYLIGSTILRASAKWFSSPDFLQNSRTTKALNDLRREPSRGFLNCTVFPYS